VDRHSFFLMLGGLAVGGALPIPPQEAPKMVAVPGIDVKTQKRKKVLPGDCSFSNATMGTLVLNMDGDEDAEYVILGMRREDYEKQKGNA
jgi:hypothetical protein